MAGPELKNFRDSPWRYSQFVLLGLLLAGPSGAQVAAIPLSALCSAAKWALVLAFALWMGWRLSAKLVR